MTEEIDPTNPLTPEMMGQLDVALGRISQAKVLIHKAKQAGIDISGAEETLRQNEEQITAIQRSFRPGVPVGGYPAVRTRRK